MHMNTQIPTQLQTESFSTINLNLEEKFIRRIHLTT